MRLSRSCCTDPQDITYSEYREEMMTKEVLRMNRVELHMWGCWP
jgi:hypothetical protein